MLLMEIDWQYVWQKIIDVIVAYGPRFLLAIAVLVVGLQVIKFMVKVFVKALEKSNNDESLNQFLKSLITWSLKIMLFVSVAGMVGIHTTSFVAMLGAAGLAVGLALQGALANFAGGVLILLFKPFKVGHLIKAQGELGTVTEIQIIYTILVTAENKTIVIPNGPIIKDTIVNYTTLGSIRVDLEVGIGYDDNIKKAREVIMKVLEQNEMILDEPKPVITVDNLGDSAVELSIRPWTNPENYWTVHLETLEDIKNALDEAGITIPYDQLDLHIKDGTLKEV